MALRLKIRTLCGALLVASALAACSTALVIPDQPYLKSARNHLYALRQWSLEGRLAMSAKKDSWSANMAWQHDASVEEIKLSGPLGQGAALIRLTKAQVVIDRGGKGVQTSTNPEQFIEQQLGMAVPIHSLRYWVVGLPEPGVSFFETEAGFKQGQWLVAYKEMQSVGNQAMPRKITVMNDQVRLKVIIDQWTLNDIKPN
ncbi:Outer membrane lipoprotein LolB (modular protein) [Crenothrix polyspora]|uniref:Outer-membrane lipoprotein LolB n=1 Tax=Crenothrix polyspora TaxID=360316 RepID=A0A1R4HGP9_9GAMM|nr:lipoprotein insertase outer membrane protein LolB [Crenothrix polyspora]SJM95389.1 Outer membrane lipoprotein LolB (modular protein) [Crenothrix polyspora]